MSCLFQSIGACLGLSAAAVRTDIVHYMREHGDDEIADLKLKHWIEGAEDKTWDTYLWNMSSGSEWGGGPELDVACILYDVDIVIQHAGGTLRIGAEPASGDRRVITLRYTGSHYTVGER